MEQLVHDCQSLYSHADWEAFVEIDFERDLIAVREWAEKLLEKKPIPESVNIIWFGIYNPMQRGKASADFYLSGASDFYANVDVDQWDWKKRYWPAGRYAKSNAMKEIYRIAYQEGGLGNAAEYTLCLGYTALVAKSLSKKYADELSKTRSPRAVGVGFDSGDYLLVGALSRQGLKRLDEKKFLKPPVADADQVQLFEFGEERHGNWYLSHPEDLEWGYANRHKKEKTSEEIVLRLYAKGKKTNLNITVHKSMVVTKKLADLMEKLAPGDFQRIPVKVQGERGKYEFINVLSNPMWKPLVQWAKENKAKVSHTPVEFQLMKIGKCASTFAIARPMKEALEKFGVTGVSFRPLLEPDDWQYDDE